MLPLSPVISTFALILALIYLKGDAAPTSEGVGNVKCPYNESEWKERSANFFCQGKDVYHCFLAENQISVKEKCIERTTLQKGFCPVFSDDGYLHWVRCNQTGCPNVTYVSDEVYKYRVCFEDTDSITFRDEEDEESGGLALGLGLGLGLGVGILLVIGVSVLVHRMLSRQTKETEEITNGTTALRSESIIYVVGNLGNSVSTVGKGIVEAYAKKHNMDHIYSNYLDISEDFDFSPNTIYFVDGWFGLWNDNPCEKSGVLDCLRRIIEAGKETTKEIKFVIGLRTDIRDLYKEDFNDIGIVFSQRQTLLRETSTKEKGVKLKKHLQKVKRKCTADGCQCKSLEISDIMSIDKVPIGPHLIVKLLNLDHTKARDLVDEDKGPLTAMCEHFMGLESKDEQLFKCIMYIVLIGFYDENDFRHDVATHFSISKTILKECDLKKYTKRLKASQLAPMWTSQLTGGSKERDGVYVFWHNFLYICAFHACFALYPDKMMQHCNVDAILQLVRPIGQRSLFTVEADKTLISRFYQDRISGKVIECNVKDHPLLMFLRDGI
ncbi:uncharacterized protein LOC125648651 [Ostrea edulis]|uniref:uncharacterized protein LOC125648651 n=1 Tax=Ostrea edulis TaxID=37623 RepID=UPI0024AFC569|nr:uncharacterized protein LOC125648651 [Ostrea edulis]XP_056008886.1 uncharacterized protein LOC125648651 [Ostrea edulis]XP_056008887.1 uncharacterized protein LOC125648651 [Ostrea edulis]XP_056008888.1 uncharacterized protein LOC125648651 [Ostrea edulis]